MKRNTTMEVKHRQGKLEHAEVILSTGVHLTPLLSTDKVQDRYKFTVIFRTVSLHFRVLFVFPETASFVSLFLSFCLDISTFFLLSRLVFKLTEIFFLGCLNIYVVLSSKWLQRGRESNLYNNNFQCLNSNITNVRSLIRSRKLSNECDRFYVALTVPLPTATSSHST